MLPASGQEGDLENSKPPVLSHNLAGAPQVPVTEQQSHRWAAFEHGTGDAVSALACPAPPSALQLLGAADVPALGDAGGWGRAIGSALLCPVCGHAGARPGGAERAFLQWWGRAWQKAFLQSSSAAEGRLRAALGKCRNDP